jgi:hypothetical protein
MKNINADKIIWTGNTLDEMRRLLGGDIEIEFPEMMDRAGLDYPWPISILGVNYDSTSQSEYVYVRLGFDEINGASDYEVRISLVPPPAPPAVSDRFGMYPAGAAFLQSSLSSPITANDRCIMIMGDIPDGPSGMFSTWTKIYGDNSASWKLSVWMGSGVGSGNLSVSSAVYTGFGVYGIHSVGFIFRDSGNMALVDSSIDSQVSTVTPISAPALTAAKDQIAVSGVVGKSGFLDRYAPSQYGGRVVTGFEDHYAWAADGDADLYSKGAAGSAGRTFGGTVDGSWDMATSSGDGGGQAGNFVFTWSGV